MLVGQTIVEVREKGPDQSQYLPGPVTGQYPTYAVAPSGTFTAGTYYIVQTFITNFGETLPGATESSIALNGTTETAISGTALFPASIPPEVTALKLYIGTSAGAETRAFLVPRGSTSFRINSLNAMVVDSSPNTTVAQSGTIPTRSSAMLPDTDGSFISAATAYRWLNDALQRAGRIGGGIPSLSGVQAVAGRAIYQVSGTWLRTDVMWYDGWPLFPSKKTDVFLHNTVTAISGFMTIEEAYEYTRFQLWPQPSRGGSSTVTTSGIGPTDSNIPIASASGFLPLGLCLIDDEIIAYSKISSLTLQECTRGCSGTKAVSHASGNAVDELNIRISGLKQPSEYAVGDSLSTLSVPPAWERVMADYMLAQYRRAEQQDQQADQMEADFDKSIQILAKMSVQRKRPRQIGYTPREVYGGSWGGGWLIS